MAATGGLAMPANRPRRLSASLFLCALSLVPMPAAAELQGSEWKPLRIGDDPVPEESSAFVQFQSQGRLRGYCGCNRMFAEYESRDGQIFIGPVAATRMACADAVMAREAALAAALENARTYRRDRGQLTLFDGSGQPILELRRTDWD